MNCISTLYVDNGGSGHATSSRSRRTPIHHASTTHATRSWGKAPATPEASDDSEGNEFEEDDPMYSEQIQLLAMFDAPPVTQTQGESSQRGEVATQQPCRRRAHDHTDIGSANVLLTELRRERRPNDTFTPPDQHCRRR
ncbi:hypothetical protein SETIT_8G184100v2 [Setaria italica]|uniref:Uncharacterized protein n=1 Tax=Setaria italica TaxID=4555 RepID=A0A368S936_SETIT|nr:hypothetical protein SETIT_8G184100v2 [Setaria italica]